MSKVKIFLLLQSIFFFSLPVLAQVDTGWVRRYSGPGNGEDIATALAVDASGNVYVTGYSGKYPNFDYATIKYAPNGDTAWIRRYNGPGNNEDRASALGLDNSGSVYVTGYSFGVGTSYDYATIKYGPSGETLWVSRYNGPANSADGAYALAADESGNVWVTGYSLVIGLSTDYFTIQYAPNGDVRWFELYNNPAGRDYPTALALDTAGNLYVTGSSTGSGTFGDYATLKYSPDGEEFWVSRYDGTGNYNDAPSDLAVDNVSNIYVTGFSQDSGLSSSYATIKYAPNGNTLWVRRFRGAGNGLDGASALTVDAAGNIYVTGRADNYCDSFCHTNYLTIKYTPSGDTLWVRRYNGPENGYDVANALAVDDGGNVYVTGVSEGDYVTIKYAPNGDTSWVRRYNGPGNGVDEAIGLAVDTAGNVYITGRSWNGANYDYVTIKYNKFGCAGEAGDVNSDYKVDLSDIMLQINYLFKAGAKPDPFCSGDANANGNILLTDIVYLINYIFRSGLAPIKSNECCL